MMDADLEDTETGLNDMAFKSAVNKRVVKKKKKRVVEGNYEFLEDAVMDNIDRDNVHPGRAKHGL